MSGPARQLLELRQGGAGAAASKFPTLRRWTDANGEPRIRYAYRYHGASSGRFTSLGCQLHNLRKPELEDVGGAIAAVATGSLAEMRRRGFERPLEAVGQIVRAAIIPKPGTRLFIADLSGIEARKAAYVCGAVRELEQWREFDRSGRPEDEPYYITGIATFRQPPATARKAGKTGALAFQYQGGVGAYRRITGDLEMTEEAIKRRRDAWRADHVEFTRFWQLTTFQAVQAIRHPGMEFSAKAMTFIFDQRTGFLELGLPSGRKLTYPAAELFEDVEYGTTSFTFLDASGSKNGRMYHERKGGGVFGGLLLENITQALCRDLFVETMPQLEAAGYSIVMHTHDEWVCEVPEGHGSLDEFLAIVTTPPAWAPDLPIAAKGRISDRLIEIVAPAQAPIVAADNAIDNALIVDDEDDEEETEEDGSEETRVVKEVAETPAPTPAPERHICAHCHAPPDGTERPSSYNDAWLHARCIDDFIQAREDDLGITRTKPAVPRPPNGGVGNNETTVAVRPNGSDADCSSWPSAGARSDDGYAARSGNGYADGYPHGERAAPSAAAVEEYIYKNASSHLHMRVVRYADKTFPTYRWDGGDWVPEWPKEAVPYRLPELLAAPADTIVLVCEGERDCDTAARYGFIATTNPGGAGKWQPELAQYFHGEQRVCIMQDNDAPGVKHTAAIIAALRGIVPTLGVVEFLELGPGGDLTEYFERGGTKPYLVTRIEEALKRGATPDYTLIDLDKVPLEAAECLWEPHLPVGALELTTGLPNVGKSLAQCDWIAIATTGRNWPDGAPGPKPGHVIVLTAEDRVADVKRRLLAAEADLRLVHVFGDVRRNERDEQFLLAQDLDKLEHAVNSLGDVRLVTIDPITAYMGSGRGFDSHRATDVRSQLLPLSKLAEKLNIAFSAVTHPPKNAAMRTAIDSFIGSQAFIAAARVGHYCLHELGEEDDRGRRRPTGRVLFTTVRCSHAATPLTLAYHIEVTKIGWDTKRERDITAPRIMWEPEPIDLTADEAIAANKMKFEDGRKAKTASIKEFLRDILASGPVLQKIVVERGAARGFSLDQLRRARDPIGARSFKRRGKNLDSPWMWALLEHVPADVETE